jgi:serine/threonine protein kinase
VEEKAMMSKRWQQIDELVGAALELETSEREAFLKEKCLLDEGLYREVKSLIEASEAAAQEEFLDKDMIKPEEIVEMLVLHQDETINKLIGKKLDDRYLVESVLGEGGMGIVFKAIDTKLNSRPVIIKLLLNHYHHNKYVKKKFLHEIEGLSRINHPGVVSVYDKGYLQDGRLYMVIEYVRGKTLREIINQETMALPYIATIIRQVGNAISAAHQEKVIHRDLKPENIMLQILSDNKEQIKVIDFGIAKLVDPQSATATQTTVLVGTPAYMAAEQLETGEVSEYSDIYSLGVIAYEMVTGQLPFNIEKTTPAAISQLAKMQCAGVEQKPKILRPELPDTAETLILKALSYRPEHRYSSANQFTEALAEALTSTVPTSDGPTRNAFERLWEMAKPTEQIAPLSFDRVQKRGLGNAQHQKQYVYHLGSRICLLIDLKTKGHLTLLDEGADGIIYCLCPSQFALNTKIKTKQHYLPHENSRFEFFHLDGKPGKERLVAIVTKEPLRLNWLPNDPETPARTLSETDMETLLNNLKDLNKEQWVALSTYFEVIA